MISLSAEPKHQPVSLTVDYGVKVDVHIHRVPDDVFLALDGEFHHSSLTSYCVVIRKNVEITYYKERT